MFCTSMVRHMTFSVYSADDSVPLCLHLNVVFSFCCYLQGQRNLDSFIRISLLSTSIALGISLYLCIYTYTHMCVLTHKASQLGLNDVNTYSLSLFPFSASAAGATEVLVACLLGRVFFATQCDIHLLNCKNLSTKRMLEPKTYYVQFVDHGWNWNHGKAYLFNILF